MRQDVELGYLVLRLATGLDLFLHGAVRVGPNFPKFQGWLLGQFEKTPLPPALVNLTSYLIPGAELVLGLLLLAGARTKETLLGASALMLLLIFGSCLIQNWESVAIQLFMVQIYALLLAGRAYNTRCVD